MNSQKKTVIFFLLGFPYPVPIHMDNVPRSLTQLLKKCFISWLHEPLKHMGALLHQYIYSGLEL